MDLALWIPLVVLFASALIGAWVRRYSKDTCLKLLQGSLVYILLKDRRWVWGHLNVFSNALELIFTKGEDLHGRFEKRSYIFYEHNLETIELIVRPSPAEGTDECKQWRREIRLLQNPPLHRRWRRKMRNIFNMLRDAFAQSITMIFGAVKRKGGVGNLPIEEAKVGEVGKTLITVVPNAYEPVLEKYLGHKVVVETPAPENNLFEQVGILQEYTAKYILVRDVDDLPELPPQENNAPFANKNFDVVFPRPASTLRHLAVEKRPAPPFQ
jgi:hypothetical protein